jgi:hypothetical protein
MALFLAQQRDKPILGALGMVSTCVSREIGELRNCVANRHSINAAARAPCSDAVAATAVRSISSIGLTLFD